MSDYPLPSIETCWAGYRFRSRLEARWAVFFQALGIRWAYELEGFKFPSGRYYLPDFHIPSQARHPQELWVEIKPPLYEELKRDYGDDLKEIQGFALICGEPRFVPSAYLPEYEAQLDGDNPYYWCRCQVCGMLGLQFSGWSDRIGCTCTRPGKAATANDPFLQRAYRAAMYARFEHGERPEDLSVSDDEAEMDDPKEWIDALHEAQNLSVWEQDFLESVSDQYDERGTLTDAQCEKLEEIYAGRVLGKRRRS